MAAPTKAEREKREKIKELGLFIRDSEFYTTFENEADTLSLSMTSYSFCSMARYRELGNQRANHLDHEHNQRIVYNLLTRNIPVEKKVMYDKLKILDEKIYCRALHCLMVSNDRRVWDKEKNYSIYNIVNNESLEEIFQGEKNPDLNYNFEGDGIPFPSIDEHTIEYLTKKEKNTLTNHIIPYITLIKRHTIFPDITQFTDWNRSTYVELDFTKPLSELIEFITKIKKDFDNNPKTIQTIDDLFGRDYGIHSCNLENCDIYKTKNPKPIGGRLADVLFIYDCKKAGLDNDYILNEINKYWTETKNLFKDKMQLKTLREYHNLAIDYIDNGKYVSYLSGCNIGNVDALYKVSTEPK